MIIIFNNNNNNNNNNTILRTKINLSFPNCKTN